MSDKSSGPSAPMTAVPVTPAEGEGHYLNIKETREVEQGFFCGVCPCRLGRFVNFTRVHYSGQGDVDKAHFLADPNPPLPESVTWSQLREDWDQNGAARFDAAGASAVSASRSRAWEKFKNDFDAMSDNDIIAETRRMEDQATEAEEWLEAVVLWEAAGRPRKAGDQ